MKGKQYDVAKLANDQNLADTFKVTIGVAFAPLMAFEDQDINQLYDQFKNETNKITESIISIKRNSKTEGLGKEVEDLCKQRRNARLMYIKDPKNTNARETYKLLNKIVKREIKVFKKKKIEHKIQLMELDFHQNNSYNLFKTVKELEGTLKKTVHAVIDKQGKKLTDINSVLKCRKEHFQEHLSKGFPHHESAKDGINKNNQPDIPLEPITKEEVQRSISVMKIRKAPGANAISAEVLKAGGDEMTKFLLMLFNKVWREENPPVEWSKMIVTPVHKKGNKTDPSNYGAISLLSIPGKVFSHILVQRIKQKSE